MSSSKSRQFDLLGSVNATNAETRLLTAIRCGASGAGVIGALQQTQSALQALYKLTPTPRIHDWLNVSITLKSKCEALEAGTGQGDFRTELRQINQKTKIPVFSVIANPPGITLGANQATTLMALLGQIILSAVSTNSTINAIAVEGWATLRRCGNSRMGRHEDWATVASSIPITVEAIDAALAFAKPIQLRTLLEVARESFATPFSDANQLDAPQNAGAAMHTPREWMNVADENSAPNSSPSKSFDDVEDPDDQGLDESGDEDTDESQKNENQKYSPTGWLIKQSNFARYTQQFGLSGDRDRTHPLQVQRTWKEMMCAFREGDSILKDQIALAHISYKSSFPGRMALELSIDQLKYPNVNLSEGGFNWNFGHALHKQTQVEETSTPPMPRSEIESIFICFDEEIADYLRYRHSQNPGARRISEVFAVNSKKEWLKRYRRECLRRFGDPAHPNFDARFARSAGDVCNYVLGREIESIFLAQNYQSCTFGTLHYLSLPTKHLQACEKVVNDYLGFNTKPFEVSDEPKGSMIYISKEDFTAGWKSLQNATLVAINALKSAVTQDELVTSFNDLAALRLVALITLLGHRGKKLSRLTWRALYTHQKLLLIYDKDVGDYQSNRVLPAHKLADQVLAAWQIDLQHLFESASALEIDVAKEGRRGISAENLDQPAFFFLKATPSAKGIQLNRSPIKPSSLEKITQLHFGKPLNIGRHFLVSQLAIRGVSVWLIRVLTGHARAHAEAFSDSMGVPPEIALCRLQGEIETLLHELHLTDVPCTTDLPYSRRLYEPRDSVPTISTDPYLHPSLGAGLRVLPPPFDSHTLTSLRIVEALRAKLLKSVSSLNFESSFVALLTLVNCIDISDQIAIYKDLNASIVKIGTSNWAMWRRPNCSAEICFPLIGPTAIALVKVNRQNPGAWEKHARQIGAWVTTEFPELPWQDDEFDAFQVLVAMAARYRRYICSPLALTAQSTAIPSSTPSRRSLLRLASIERKTEPDALGQAIRRGAKKTNFRVEGPLLQVTKALRKVGNTKKREGEELARAKLLKSLLEKVDTSADQRAKSLKDVCIAEAILREENSNLANDFSTLSGYLDDVLIAVNLLSPNDDLSTMPSEEIEEWVQESIAAIDSFKKNAKKVELDETRYFGLKRFVRIGAMLGWEVPKDLFQDGPRAMFSGMRKSAASTLLLQMDHEEIQEILKTHFAGWPLLSSRACLAENLLWNAPLRSSEQSILRKSSVTASIDAISVHADGYSHLKSRHAPRIIPIPNKLASEIRDIQFDTIGENNFFLFLDDEGNDWSKAREIDAAIINAASIVTGESTVRKHTYRASATARKAAPDWEQIAKALLNNTWTAQQHRVQLEKSCELGFANFVRATRDAGHGHSLTTTVYYFSVWPFVLANQLTASLADFEPDGKYLTSILGNTDRIRTAKTRAKKSGNLFNACQEAIRIAVDVADVAPLLPTDPDVIVLPYRSTDTKKVANAESCVQFAADVLLGLDRDVGAEANGIINSLAHRIDSQLPQGLHRKAFQRRRHGYASGHALEIDRRFLRSLSGIELQKHLMTRSLSHLSELANDLNPDRLHSKSPSLSGDDLLNRIKRHLDCLPLNLGIKLQFGLTHHSAIPNEFLHLMRDRLFIGTPSDRIGAFPRFQVVDCKHPTRETTTGRWSVAARVLSNAIVSIFKVRKEFGYES